tara:strand:- start:139 stop:276 length:138 start_codon:yes stop_codon:yes gene_type:complete
MGKMDFNCGISSQIVCGEIFRGDKLLELSISYFGRMFSQSGTFMT